MKYYSDVLNKPFNTIKELNEAEEAHNKELKTKEEALSKKKEEASKVEDAYKKYLDGVKTNNEKRKELNDIDNANYRAYLDARMSFIKKYGSYHMTYTNDDDDTRVKVTTSNAFNDLSDFIASFIYW